MSTPLVVSEPTPPAAPSPKVFISYSWTTPAHQNRVRGWAEHLIQDGVEVIFDQFDLKEGQDKFHFMEKMVTDGTVTHVLVCSDRLYAEKADNRTAGVGTESQIISAEVYGKVEQSKFIPIACELDESTSEPMMPSFLRARKYIDFSSLESANANWEQLVRVLYGKPEYVKPQLGQPPKYLELARASTSTPASARLSLLQNALSTNSRRAKEYRRDFIEALLAAANYLRVTKNPGLTDEKLGEQIIADSLLLTKLRNTTVDWLATEFSNGDTEDVVTEQIIHFFEGLYALKGPAPGMNQYVDDWFAAMGIFVYECFLYTIAIGIRHAAFGTLNHLLRAQYLKPRDERYGKEKFNSMRAFFYGDSSTLNQVLAKPRTRLFSSTVELVKRQSDRSDVKFDALAEADVLIYLAALTSEGENGWWVPQTLFYTSTSEFPLFLRASQHRGFCKLNKALGISSADEVRERVRSGEERLQLKRYFDFHRITYAANEIMNLDQLDSI